jgi:hypothetical protein
MLHFVCHGAMAAVGALVAGISINNSYSMPKINRNSIDIHLVANHACFTPSLGMMTASGVAKALANIKCKATIIISNRKEAMQRTDYYCQLHSQQLLEGTCLLCINATGLAHKRYMGLQDSVSKVSV